VIELALTVTTGTRSAEVLVKCAERMAASDSFSAAK